MAVEAMGPSTHDQSGSAGGGGLGNHMTQKHRAAMSEAEEPRKADPGHQISPMTLSPRGQPSPVKLLLMPSYQESRKQPWVWATCSRRAELTVRAKAPVTEVPLFLHGKNK